MSQIALVGGNEFRRDCDAMDRELIAAAGGPEVPIAILPTAATNENPYVAGESGIRHFRRLGAAPEKLMIDDRDAANNEKSASALEHFRMVYFTGGDPVYLLDTMRASSFWEATLRLYRGGGLIAGSSAGAMALCGQMWRFDSWVPGLNLVPHLAVLPHHATLSTRWNGAAMALLLPSGVTMVGIDDATALLLPSGRVVGVGEVTVYHLSGLVKYQVGEVVPLQAQLE